MNLTPAKTEFSEVDHVDLRREVEEIKTIERLTEAEIGRQAEVNASTLNAYLKAKYAGDNNGPAAKLHRWVKSRAAAAAVRASMPTAPSFVRMRGSQEITNVLAYAQQSGRITVICGAPGVSKTSTARQYAHATPRVWLATMDPSTRRVSTMLVEILAAMGEPEAHGTPQTLSRRVCRRAQEAAGLIIVDESQHLSDLAIEQLRSINDKVHVGIALLGNETAWTKMGGTGTKAAFAQVSSRMAMRRWVLRPDPRDVDALGEAWAEENGEDLDARGTEFLRTIAAKPGGLRNVEMTMEAAILAARGAGARMGIEHLQGAYAALSGLDRRAL